MTITSDNVTSASTSNNLIALTFTASEGVIDFDKNCIKVIGPDSNIISDTDSLISNFMIQEHEVTFKPYDTACYSTGECTGTLTNYLKPMVFTANLDLTSAVKGNYIISVYDGTEPSSSGTIPRFKSYSGNLNEVNTDDKNLSFTYDNINPLITLNGPSTVDHILGSSYIDQGATATDNIDGDISSSIITSGLEEVNINQVGSYTITYNVSDSAGNSATQVTRTVNVQELTGPLTITLNPVPSADNSKTREINNDSYHLRGETYSDPGVKVENELGTDITNNVTIVKTIEPDGVINTDNLGGNYTITYNVTNSGGDIIGQSVKRIVRIVSKFK